MEVYENTTTTTDTMTDELGVEGFRRIRGKEYVEICLKRKIRSDGRALSRRRTPKIVQRVLDEADGSAMAEMGGTKVLVGIRLEVTYPRQDTPNEGEMDLKVHIGPSCSPKFKPGPAPEESFLLTRFLETTLDNARAVDMSQLCIEKNRSCWIMKVNVHCLSYDGNLRDVALLALTSALVDVEIPAHETDEENRVVFVSGPAVPLQVSHLPASFTFAHFSESDTLIFDPTTEEEDAMDTSVSVVLNERGVVVGLSVPGGAGVSEEVLRRCVVEANGQNKSTHEELNRALENRRKRAKGAERARLFV